MSKLRLLAGAMLAAIVIVATACNPVTTPVPPVPTTTPAPTTTTTVAPTTTTTVEQETTTTTVPPTTTTTVEDEPDPTTTTTVEQEPTTTTTERGPPESTTTTTTTPQPAPITGEICIWGDSLGQQSLDPYGDRGSSQLDFSPLFIGLEQFGISPDQVTVRVHAGWSTIDAYKAITVQPTCQDPEDTNVIALGTNDASTYWGADGWRGNDGDPVTNDDEANFRRFLNEIAGTKMVFVLPAMLPTANAAWRAEVQEARPVITAIAAEYGRSIVLDWLPVMEAHASPDEQFVDEDGIHNWTATSVGDDIIAISQGLVNPSSIAAAGARQQLIYQGVVTVNEQYALAG